MVDMFEVLASAIRPTVVSNYFPDDFLSANGYSQYFGWDDNKKAFSISLNSGFIIYVVESKGVWLEANGKLNPLINVLTGEDLLNLSSLLG